MLWSYSRRSLLERCPRAYYYQYYGANRNTARAEPLKERLHFLKSLTNRHLRAGDIVHLVIRTYLNKLKEKDVWEVDRVLNWARQIFQKDYAYSSKYRPTDPRSRDRFPPALLSEFYYNIDDAESLFRESQTRMLSALRNFIENPTFANFRDGSCDSNALIEKSVSVKSGHFSLRGKLDLAYSNGDRVAVVDWKIGKSEGGDDSLQLLSYALGAIKEFDCQPNRIDLYRVHLSDSVIVTFRVSEREVMRAEGRIIQDIERMEAMHRYGKQAVADAFTPCGQPLICKQCSFQEICPKE